MFRKKLTVSYRLCIQSLFNVRAFTAASISQNAGEGNLFGSLTKDVDILASNNFGKISSRLTVMSDNSNENKVDKVASPKDQITISNDKELQRYIIKKQQPIKLAPELILSPLKRKLYEANCKKNGGFYKKDTILKMPNSNVNCKLKLSRDEIDILEPSVYVKSYRIKSSMKKATVLLRLLNGLDLKRAITQCHFSNKKIARSVADLLTRGIEDAKQLGLDPDDLYISQIWTGSDGNWLKRIDIKGRGRSGRIVHPYCHVRCILKVKSITKKRLEYERELKECNKKPWIQLTDKKIRGAMGGVYRW